MSRELPAGRFLVPFGNDKGEYLDDVSTKGLVWLRDKIEDAIEDPERSSWKAKNLTLRDAIDEVLRERERGQ